MNLFKNESSAPKTNAQRNLMGRTHYVDPDTLRFHKSRILSARHTDNGLLFAIITSDALDPRNSKRGFRYVIFNIFGTVLERPKLEETFRTSRQAETAMWKAINGMNAKQLTLDAIHEQSNRYARDMAELANKVRMLPQ